MTISEQTKDALISISVVCILIGIGLFFGFLIGRTMGADEAYENSRKWECQAEFSGQAMKDISGECLKYFIPKDR